ncbi:MAG TPA: hypothetical protein VNJ08_15155 [Bacteriovoracaceae bacterium]|nr:hypothetical protein [Bacteriovoracaceae bacterium]
MKQILAILTFSLSLSAIAQQEVLLNAKEVTVNSADAILVRTNQTPRDVKVNFNVPMSSSICERHETRYVPTTVLVNCGTDYRIDRTVRRECIRRNPHNNECLNWKDLVSTHRVPVTRYCPTIVNVPETYCAQFGTAVRHEIDSMKLTFKNLPALADSERDTFIANARQGSYGGGNVVWSMKAVQTVLEYKISERKVLGLFNTDGFKIEVK